MLRSLKPHPSTPSTSVNSLTVEATRTPAGILHLSYRLEGDIARLHLPDPDGPSRKDNLWHHTCFEVFIAPGTDPAYREFNLAPSTRWAAYRFTAYRKGMANLDQPHPPIIAFTATDREIRLDATMSPYLPADEPWRLAVTTVIEEKSGHKSFWSLHHPDPRPEFHHPEGFVLHLEAP
jgi:hypothetical protein